MFMAANSITEWQWYGKARIWIASEMRKHFPFAAWLIILLSAALERSARWCGAVSKGNSETLQEFSFLCMNISLQHTLKFKSPQELTANLTWNWGISHYLLTKAYTQPLYAPFTLSGCPNGPQQPVSPSLFLQPTHAASSRAAGCLSSRSCRQLLHFIFCHREKRGGQSSSVLSPQCTGHCVPTRAVLQTH